MAKLKAAARKELPKSEFGLPGSRKYPMPNRAHAANAKARDTAGSEGQPQRICRRSYSS